MCPKSVDPRVKPAGDAENAISLVIDPRRFSNHSVIAGLDPAIHAYFFADATAKSGPAGDLSPSDPS